MHGWEGGHHAPVALIGDEAQGSGFCYGEVHTAEAYVRPEKDFTQRFAGGAGECRNILCIWDPQLLVEEPTDIVPAQMDGRRNDVGGPFPAELHNVFAKV